MPLIDRIPGIPDSEFAFVRYQQNDIGGFYFMKKLKAIWFESIFFPAFFPSGIFAEHVHAPRKALIITDYKQDRKGK